VTNITKHSNVHAILYNYIAHAKKKIVLPEKLMEKPNVIKLKKEIKGGGGGGGGGRFLEDKFFKNFSAI
jgi:hypothetical protein